VRVFSYDFGVLGLPTFPGRPWHGACKSAVVTFEESLRAAMDRVGTLHQVRREYIRKVLAHTKGDLEQASRILGITPATLRGLLREQPASLGAEKDQPKSKLKQGYEHDEKN
jgi:hypothetical protein